MFFDQAYFPNSFSKVALIDSYLIKGELKGKKNLVPPHLFSIFPNP